MYCMYDWCATAEASGAPKAVHVRAATASCAVAAALLLLPLSKHASEGIDELSAFKRAAADGVHACPL